MIRGAYHKRRETKSALRLESASRYGEIGMWADRFTALFSAQREFRWTFEAL